MNTITFHRTTVDDQQLIDLVEEITQKIQSGESFDSDQYAARHPEYADRLRNWILAMTAMADLAHSIAAGSTNRAASSVVRGSPDPAHSVVPGSPDPAHSVVPSVVRGSPDPAGTSPQPPVPSPSSHTLGDFRILRELGRGGMGVVYEAEQLSIGRRVALKVLPFAAMLDKQQLARFKNEARAAGTLDHPNIVPVYSVGTERGVHYYAMQLVEGQSLAELIAAMKPGRPPSALEPADQRAGPSSAPASREAATQSSPTASDTAKAALPTVHDHGSAAFSTLSAASLTLCTRLPNLRRLYLRGIELSEDNQKQLDQRFPRVEIISDFDPDTLHSRAACVCALSVEGRFGRTAPSKGTGGSQTAVIPPPK